ncbi:hypothetical protein TSST111916_15070 [Tsukamurella strandjordii]|uniref:hypothetical protein n=1 Tax=Tsukamurella TaxID=2060 RepID=UPI001C7D2CC9|nr:hypothetical protein [Tsukamurella sp. TY48]GIZ96814.1 hypothetical protein TTY48_14260 [Tsukamurella sp. TY48]
MGWNVSILHIAAPGPDAGGALILGDDRRQDPAGDDDAWAGTVGAGTAVVSGGVLDPDAVQRFAAQVGVPVTSVMIGNTGGAYGIEVFRDGALVRRVGETDDGFSDQSGTPLPQESAPEVVGEKHSEDRYFALFAAIAGIDDLRFLTDADFARVLAPELTFDLDEG